MSFCYYTDVDLLTGSIEGSTYMIRECISFDAHTISNDGGL